METINEVNLFIQRNQKFYEEKFKKMNDTGKSDLGTGQHFS